MTPAEKIIKIVDDLEKIKDLMLRLQYAHEVSILFDITKGRGCCLNLKLARVVNLLVYELAYDKLSPIELAELLEVSIASIFSRIAWYRKELISNGKASNFKV